MKKRLNILWLFFGLLFLTTYANGIGHQGHIADSVGIEKKDGQVLLLYKVSPGETLYSITRKYEVTIAGLKELNPSLEDGLKAGQIIKIPYAIEFMPGTPAGDIAAQAEVNKDETDFHYVVQPGETYYAISKKFGVSVKELQNLNGEVLQAGQVLVLPQQSKANQKPTLAEGKKQADPALILYPPISEQPKPRDAQPLTPAEQIALAPDQSKDGTPNTPTPKNDLAPKPIKEKSAIEKKPETHNQVADKQTAKPKPQPTQPQQADPNSTTQPKPDDAMVALEKKPKPKPEPRPKNDSPTTEEEQPDDPLFGEDDFGAADPNAHTTLPGYPDDGTKRVLIIPFDPYLYFSDADEEIANQSDMPRNQVRTIFRRRLNALIDPIGYETIHLLGGTSRDSLKDLDRIYKSISYFKSTVVYDPNNDADAANGIQIGGKKTTWLEKQKKKIGTQNFTLANRDRNELKYYGVKVNDPEFWDYFNGKYHVQYYVFINQFEVKTNYENCLDRARQDYERNFIAHFSIFDKNGHLVAGNKVKVFYNSNSNRIYQIVNENMQEMANAIIARIPKQ